MMDSMPADMNENHFRASLVSRCFVFVGSGFSEPATFGGFALMVDSERADSNEQ